MTLSHLKTIFSLSFAPLFLLYINYVEVDKESLFYVSARMIPTVLSFFFFSLFLTAFLSKKAFVLSMTKRFYKKELSSSREDFLAKSDLYWVGVTLVNTLVQLYLALYGSEMFWAFYSSVGWYIYLFGAIIAQVVYGKIFLPKEVNDA